MTAGPTQGKAPTKLLTADDHPLLREALGRLVAELGIDVEVIETDSLRGVEVLLAAHQDISVVVVEIALPDANGVEAVGRVFQARPEASVLVVSRKDDPATVRAVLDAGARGFVSKRSPTRVLADALRVLLVGESSGPLHARSPGAENEATGEPSTDPTPPGSVARELDVQARCISGKGAGRVGPRHPRSIVPLLLMLGAKGALGKS